MARAIGEQAHRLNTNTRYLHPLVLDYAERLTGLLPDPLEVCYLVNSGSEANELALRMARTVTGRRGVLVLEHAYHGNTGAMIDISPYKHGRRGGSGAPDWVRAAPAPDLFRGRHRAGPAFGARSRDAEEAACDRYLADLVVEADALAAGPGLAAFFTESIMSCAGQIEPPPGFLRGAAGIVRERGGLWIADEVQVGFGRVGEDWWAFARDGVVPDIVTLGKPIGNGHPLAAVVTTRAVADAFANGMEFFSTFGGNPVSAAAGLAVLDVLEGDGLPAHAARVGARLKEQLVALARRHPRIGDVRGRGLFLGLELVREGGAPEPDAALAKALVEHARARGVLLSTDGPDENVIKIKPPLVFGDDEAALLIAVLRSGLEALAP
ncbi:MAG: aminotransferase class III-fold pyridoxal phosphate-dependent enzyme [Planctomycetota bacterium]